MRYLTKSRFNLALDCPTKIFYTRKKEEYSDRSSDDDFLQSLADGGHQVGALAQAYHPGGTLIDTLDHAEAVRRTDELIQQENVVIYEAAFLYKNLFIRTDVLLKTGREIKLIEVKAKSCTPDENFFNKNGKLNSEWKTYLHDIAFQDYVLRKAKPGYAVHAFLMCADKSKRATVDGLNRRFQISRDAGGRTSIKVVGRIDAQSLGERMLYAFAVGDIVARIQTGELFSSALTPEDLLKFSELPGLDPELSQAVGLTDFEKTIFFYAHHYERDERIAPVIGVHCKGCQFQAIAEEVAAGKKDGFRACWREAAGFQEADFNQPQTLDVWNWRGREAKIQAGQYFQRDARKPDFPKEHVAEDGGLSAQGRQWLQCEMSVAGLSQPYVDREYLKRSFGSWRYPLHFIDFETSMAALPYHVGCRPYEQVAFQFSHHLVTADGTIAHAGQSLLAAPGVYPNFDFVRALQREIGHDAGTVFRYAAHENTVLNQLREQLLDSNEPDRAKLIGFIESITHPTKSTVAEGRGYSAGPRDMVDLRDLIMKAFYHPAMKGSNSIKAVFPAVLNSSHFLQRKYSQPIYGAEIPSLNFSPFPVVELDQNGLVQSPYLRLAPVLDGMEPELIESELLYGEEEVIKEGGAAAVAYGRIQFTDMTEAERQRVRQSLLKYCEIDTLAMVLIWEYFKNEIG